MSGPIPPVVNADPPLTGPADPVSASWGQRALIPTLLVLATAGLVALREVDRLVGSIIGLVAHDGETASIGAVTGITPWEHTTAWGIWASSDFAEGLAPLTTLYLGADLAFMIGYGGVLVILFAGSRAAQGLVILAVLADVYEDVLLVTAASALPATGSWAETGVAVAACAKWALLILAAAWALGSHRSRGRIFRRSIRAGIAVGTHRLSFLFLVGFGFLALAPLPGVNDQLPDIQRQWFDDGAWPQAVWATLGVIVTAVLFWYLGRRRTERMFAHTLGEMWVPHHSLLGWWVAWPGAILAIALIAAGARWAPQLGAWTVILAIAAGAGGVFAATHLADRAAREDGTSGRFWWFAAALAVLAVMGVAALELGARPFVSQWYFWIVALSSLAFVAASQLVVFLRRPERSSPWSVPERPALTARWLLDVRRASSEGPGDADWSVRIVRTTWLVGDAIAVLALALAPLGLVRSLIGPIAQALLPTSAGEESTQFAAIRAVFVFACVATIAVPLVSAALLRWNAVVQLAPHGDDIRPLPPDSSSSLRKLYDPRVSVPVDDPLVSRIDVALVAFWALVVAIALVVPRAFGAIVGPAAATVILMTAWGGILGGLILSLQRRRPLPVFVQLGFRSTPVLTLTLVLLLVTSWFINPAELHAVRVAGAEAASDASASTRSATADARFTKALRKEFTEWKEKMAGCEATSGVWPLVLLAAEGGGGRAAYWTADGMSRLRAEPESGCLDESLFVASGISGGSVGLVVDQLSAESGSESSQCATQQTLADETESVALAAVTCMTGPDALAAVVTGMLAGDLVAGGAGVRVPTVDGRWADRAALLELGWEEQAKALDADYSGAEDTGPFLLINSTDAVSGCRVTVVQLDMDPAVAPAGSEPLSLDDCGSPSTGAGATIDFDTAWPGCSTHLRWSTVALLSARFPFVTPAGRMPVPSGGDCAAGPEAQLVDGGYAEGSGLGALSDLLPEVLRLIEKHNECAAEGSALGCAGAKPVVPIVVYLKNDRGFEVDASVEKLAAEALVPLVGVKAATQQNTEKAWLQRISDQLQTLPKPRACAIELCDRPIAIVSSSTSPTIAAPLGWTLSGASRESLDDAMDRDQQACSSADQQWSTLGDLLEQIGNRDVCRDRVPADPLG